MPLIKQFLKSKPEVPEIKVNFAVEKEAATGAEQVMLIDEFTQWQPVELKRITHEEQRVQNHPKSADRWPGLL